MEEYKIQSAPESLLIIHHRKSNTPSLSSLLACLPRNPAYPTLILTEEEAPDPSVNIDMKILPAGSKADLHSQNFILSTRDSILTLSDGQIHVKKNEEENGSTLNHLLGSLSLNTTRKIALYFLSEKHENPDALYQLTDKAPL